MARDTKQLRTKAVRRKAVATNRKIYAAKKALGLPWRSKLPEVAVTAIHNGESVSRAVYRVKQSAAGVQSIPVSDIIGDAKARPGRVETRQRKPRLTVDTELLAALIVDVAMKVAERGGVLR